MNDADGSAKDEDAQAYKKRLVRVHTHTTTSTHLGPHFSHVFQYHVAMPIKCLDTSQELAVVTAADEHLLCGWGVMRSCHVFAYNHLIVVHKNGSPVNLFSR